MSQRADDPRRVGRRLAFAALALLPLFASCVSEEQYRRALADNDNLRKIRDGLDGQLQALSQQNEGLRAEVERLKGLAVDPQWRARQQELERLLQEMRGAGAITGVTPRETAEGLVFEIQGEVLFASGRAEITERGRDTLSQLAGRLTASGRRLRVEGHTDTDPIRNSPWKTNLRLSAERALVVAEFLISAGVPEDRIGIAGYGPFRPRADGDSDAAKAQNRRVEILLIRGD
ncbi:MAG: OmpA family protein [Planctomycetes bacterium]|nr:OmpA family protein [Planctomycetota bacterium]